MRLNWSMILPPYSRNHSQTRSTKASRPKRFRGLMTSRCDYGGSLAPGRVALHAARIRRGPQLAVRLLDGRYAAKRPVRLDRDVVAARAQIVDQRLREARLQVE